MKVTCTCRDILNHNHSLHNPNYCCNSIAGNIKFGGWIPNGHYKILVDFNFMSALLLTPQNPVFFKQ